MALFPIVIFTKDRTGCAVAVANSILDNLRCTGYEPRYIISDDMSVPGHLEAVVRAFTSRGITPTVCRTTKDRHGLGASMNNGLDSAFSSRAVNLCLRMEDDWLLKYPLDLGPYLDAMPRLQIGALRLGMMFREPEELEDLPGTPELCKVVSSKSRIFTFNNQLAVISRSIYNIVGKYPENTRPYNVEQHGMGRWNFETKHGRLPPYVAWPKYWKTNEQQHQTLPFSHIGESLIGHKKLYDIPAEYMKYNNPALSERLRFQAMG